MEQGHLLSTMAGNISTTAGNPTAAPTNGTGKLEIF